MRIDNATGVQSRLTGSFTGSFGGEFTGVFSPSIGNAVSGAFTQDSSSFASRIDDLETFEANIDNTYATDGDVTAVSNRVTTLEDKTLVSSSIQIQTQISGSFTESSSSLAQRITSQENFSSSLDNTFATDSDVTAVSDRVTTLEDKTLISSSIQIADNISGSFTQASSSLAQRVTDNETTVSNINAATSSYLLNTSDTLTGDLTVTGTITAQEFHTEFVSASIIYQSGSTKFGDSLDDIHQFTGSVYISGSGTFRNTGPAYFLEGNVGIGTTSPSQIFAVENNGGIFRINTSTSTYPRLEIGSTTGTTAFVINRTSGTQDFKFGESSDTGNYIFRGGNVGIGTDSPSAKLEVVGEAWVGDGTDGIKLSYSAGNSTGIVDTEYTSTGLEFRVGGSEKMRIDVNGVSYFTRSSQTALINPNYGGSNTHAQIQAMGSMALAFAAGGDNERMRIQSDGGISFTQGASTIPVGGISHYTNNYLYIKGGTAGAAMGNDDFGSAFYALDNGDANIIAGSSNAVVVKASGNVGIGTTDPQAVLHLHGNTQAWTTSPTIVMSSSNTGNANVRNWRIGPADTNFGNFHIGVSDTQGGIVDSNAEASTFTIDYTGKVGIGNLSPSAALTVGTYISTHHQNHSSLPTVPGNHLVNLTPPSDTNYYGGGISWSEGTNTAASLGVYDAGGAGALGMYFATGNNTTLTERMRITTGGYVGIGTDSPTEKLHVEGRIRIGTTPVIASHDNITIDIDQNNNQVDKYFRVTKDGETSELFRVQENGNVGIGTTSPDKKLEVKISDNTDGVYFAQTIGGSRASAGYSVGIGIDPEGYGNRNKVGIVVQGHPSGWSAGKMHFLNRLDIGTNGEADLSHSRMTIDYTGLVGIGSQTPQAALDVRGSAVTRVRINSNGGTNAGVLLAENGTDYWSFASTSGGNLQFFREGGGGNKMMLTTDGNLGINTSTPSYKLDVEGAVAFTDEIMARSGTTSITNSDHVWQGKFTGNGVYIHLKTNLGWGGNTQMYSFHFLGYAYGEANPVNAQIAFYNYPPSSAPINIGSSGSHTIVLYQSSDGYIVIRIQFSNSYFTGLTMSVRNTAQGVTWPSITSTAQNGTSNHF